MVPRLHKDLFEDEIGYIPEADYLNLETRQESACRLWAGFAAASVILSFTAVSLFSPATPDTGSPVVTPAQANLTEASVTPSQVDVRIAHALGMVENRIALLEATRMADSPNFALNSHPDWSPLLVSDDLPALSHENSLETAAVSRVEPSQQSHNLSTVQKASAGHSSPSQAGISILSHIVKTESISDVPHHFLPLPDEAALRQ